MGNMEKELQGLKEGSEAKKAPIWKTPEYYGMHRYCFLKKESLFHDRLTIEMNRCQGEIDILDKGKDHTDSENPQKGTARNNYRQ